MFDFQQASFRSLQELEAYAAQAKALSLFETGVAGAGCETTLTLVTCSYEWKEARNILVAVKAEPERWKVFKVKACATSRGSLCNHVVCWKCSKAGTFSALWWLSGTVYSGECLKVPEKCRMWDATAGKRQYDNLKSVQGCRMCNGTLTGVVAESVQRWELLQLSGCIYNPPKMSFRGLYLGNI